MPKTTQRKKKCAICGETSSQPYVRLPQRHGSPDLDTRPPADVRFTIDTWVQTCPSCGYCFLDIAKRAPEAESTIRSEAYLKQLESQEFSKLANHFLCWSAIEENAGNFSGSGWACIHAAWICDDAADFKKLYGNVSGSKMGDRDEGAAASLCRLKAIRLLKTAREEGQGFGAQPGAEEALMADLLRRISRFGSAATMVQCGLDLNPTGVIDTVLHYEKELAARGDTDVHTISEAIKWKAEQTGPPEERGKQTTSEAE